MAAAQRALFAQAGVAPDDEAAHSFSVCMPTAHGAWAIEVDALRAEGCEQCWVGHWSLVHIDAAGRRVAVSLTPPSVDEVADLTTEADNLQLSSSDALSRRSAALIDYDGDGEPELALALQLNQNEAADPTRGRVWTFRDGRISLYGPAAAIDFVRADDVDGDGRLDLFVTRPFVSGYCPPESPFSYQLSGPEWVFHSLRDGGFSSADAVAVSAGRTTCPRPPAAALRTGAEVACARAWGMTTASIEAAIERGCRTRSLPQREVGRRCPELEPMLMFARHQAPTPLMP